LGFGGSDGHSRRELKPQLTVCGLGPGGEGQLTVETEELLSRPGPRYLRTTRHPSASKAGRAESFDHFYEEAPSFAEVYRGIVEALVTAATAAASGDDEAVYAVPGSPLVLEETVRLLRHDERITVRLVPALSFLDVAWARLGLDPVEAGVRLIDGLQFGTHAAGERGPLLVAHAYADHVLSDIKLAIDAGPEQRVVVLQRLGTDDEAIFEVAWPDLDRLVEADHLTSIFLPEVTAPVSFELARSVALVNRLRRDCPWDQEQDHQSLRRYLLEETHELVDAIDGLSSADDEGSAAGYEDLEEELGDVLFQVLFHAELAAEAGQFSIVDVARTLHDKLVSRHPHVFGQTTVDSTAEIVSNWDAIKQTEKQRESMMDGVPMSMPALALAQKVLQRATRAGIEVGFGSDQVAAGQLATSTVDEQAVGLALLAFVDSAAAQGIDVEGALRGAAVAAMARFRREEAVGPVTPHWVLG